MSIHVIGSSVYNSAAHFHGSVRFHPAYNENNIKIISSGEFGSMETIINFDDVNEYSITEDMELVQKFSLKYIKLMCNFNKLSNEMRLLYTEDKPMILKYDLNLNFISNHPLLGDI